MISSLLSSVISLSISRYDKRSSCLSHISYSRRQVIVSLTYQSPSRGHRALHMTFVMLHRSLTGLAIELGADAGQDADADAVAKPSEYKRHAAFNRKK